MSYVTKRERMKRTMRVRVRMRMMIQVVWVDSNAKQDGRPSLGRLMLDPTRLFVP
jgi:hypothetical protein